jgi:hypothetical protein
MPHEHPTRVTRSCYPVRILAISLSSAAATSKATSDDNRLFIVTLRSGGTSDSASSLYSEAVDSNNWRICSSFTARLA